MSRARANSDSSFAATNKHLIPQAKLAVLQRIGPLTVYQVNGSMIRDWIFIDFTEGANSMACEWLPLNEIWLDNQNDSERDFILLHEIVEYNLMMNKGWDYDKAHDAACRVEIDARRNPHKLPALMAAEAAKAGAVQSPTQGAKLAGFAKEKSGL